MNGTPQSRPEPYGSAHDLPSFVEMRQQLQVFKGLTLVFMREKRTEIKALEEQLRDMADRVDAFYQLLGPRHWVFNDSMSVTKVDELIDSSATPAEAEEKLIELYRHDESSRFWVTRLGNVPGLRERQHMIRRAREEYEADRFDTCTLLLIAVMDGFINDVEADKRKGLAARESDEMVAWDSVTGHHLGLTNALKPFLRTFKKRVDEEVFEVHRHGIVHGTVVQFDNAVVATKAWNLLFAVVDWSKSLQKKAEDDAKPPQPTIREALSQLAEYGARKRERERFQPWEISADDGEFDTDPVVQTTRAFIAAWASGRWGRLVPVLPPHLIERKSEGEAAQCAKSWFGSHVVSDVTLDRIAYTQSSVAEALGSATIDNVTANLRLRWVFWRFAFQRGETVASRSQFGRPA